MGVSEYIGLRVVVYPQDGEPKKFGLAAGGFTGGAVAWETGTADLISASWGRSIGRNKDHGAAGHMVFILPGREDGAVGLPWSEIITPCDYVELWATCIRNPDPGGDYSQKWACRFAGFVDDCNFSMMNSGTEEITIVTCSDSMGTLDYEQYSYWRDIGKIFAGSGSYAGVDIINSLHLAGFDQLDLSMNSIASAADILFKSLIYKRLMYVRNIQGQNRKWEDLHGYRFESDDFSISITVSTLAPEGSSWMDSVAWVVDAPHFYEFYMDNLDHGEAYTTLHNGGDRGAGLTSQQKLKNGLVLEGNRVETFVIRPVPFPRYDPNNGGFNDAAWRGLKTIEALPWGIDDAEVTRTRANIYSLFSVDSLNGSTVNADSGYAGGAEMMVVGDAEAQLRKVGYRPLDARTKRSSQLVDGNNNMGANVGGPQLTLALAWQLFSFNQFNDRFYGGPIHGPLDLRAELGTRYLCEGFLYYVEGYDHQIDANGANTTLTCSRGLTRLQYGEDVGVHPQHRDGRGSKATKYLNEEGLFPNYLGGKRPGEVFDPVAGDTVGDFKPYIRVHKP